MKTETAAETGEIESWPVEARISHRIILYSAKRDGMNQFAIEEIVREELAKSANREVPSVEQEGNDKHAGPLLNPNQTAPKSIQNQPRRRFL